MIVIVSDSSVSHSLWGYPAWEKKLFTKDVNKIKNGGCHCKNKTDFHHHRNYFLVVMFYGFSITELQTIVI
tara:strand:+ start:26905 stop:27117 length:213 start_codon:yes stop_codon:yes gene_type:complete